MLTFRVLGALLTYPQAETIAALPEMTAALDRESMLPRKARAALDGFLRELATDDLLDLQERYVSLFDRSRSLSLHLYEHIHGESRDRGQAMVNLTSLYQLHGLEIGARELPDYLPLFLEFLSLVPLKAARSLLSEPLAVLAALEERLAGRGSGYAVLFAALRTLAGKPVDAEELKELLAEEVDDSLAALDRAWEDTPVTFGGGAAGGAGGCGAI